jgi:NTP pyrophosphatase (non-canonical NTP hydrolase)
MLESFSDIYDLQDAIQDWAIERNLYANSTPLQQTFKTQEELLELREAIVEGDINEVKDAIGDIIVTLVNIGFYYKLDLMQCAEHSYNEIKDRKGKMVNGTFVKED